MSRSYTTSTATASVPVTVRFTCPKCGKASEVRASVFLSAEATARGYGSTAAVDAAQRKLTETEDDRLDAVAERLERGDLKGLVPNDGRAGGGGIRCPHCGLRQIPDVPERRRELFPKAFFWKVLGVFALAAFVSGMLQELARGESVPKAVASLGQALVFLAPAAMLVLNHLRSRKAYGDPALMEKRYRAVLNGRMEAEIAPADGRARTVSIPKKR